MPRLDYGNATLAGLPDYQLVSLQSMLNAAALLIFSARKYEAVSLLLRDLHWLRVTQQIELKLALLMYRCLRSTAPPYLTDQLHRVVDIDSRQCLMLGVYIDTRTADALLHHWRSHISVLASRIWNSLLPSVASSMSLTAFRPRLKSELFLRWFGPDCV